MQRQEWSWWMQMRRKHILQQFSIPPYNIHRHSLKQINLLCTFFISRSLLRLHLDDLVGKILMQLKFIIWSVHRMTYNVLPGCLYSTLIKLFTFCFDNSFEHNTCCSPNLSHDEPPRMAFQPSWRSSQRWWVLVHCFSNHSSSQLIGMQLYQLSLRFLHEPLQYDCQTKDFWVSFVSF